MNHRILIVDDEDTIRNAARLFLTSAGFRVDCASESEEGEAMIANGNYAAVITDLRFDGGTRDGFDVVAAVRARSRSTRVILLSALGGVAVEAAARSHGADLVLCKPQPMPEIKRCLDVLLGNEQ